MEKEGASPAYGQTDDAPTWESVVAAPQLSVRAIHPKRAVMTGAATLRRRSDKNGLATGEAFALRAVHELCVGEHLTDGNTDTGVFAAVWTAYLLTNAVAEWTNGFLFRRLVVRGRINVALERGGWLVGFVEQAT